MSFNVFNEFIGRTNGIAMDPVPGSQSKKGVWVDRAYGDFAFLTGVAYISKVRFIDGEIWQADLEWVTQELSSIEAGFDIKRLKEQPGKDE